jgi:hypothetical protein
MYLVTPNILWKQDKAKVKIPSNVWAYVVLVLWFSVVVVWRRDVDQQPSI